MNPVLERLSPLNESRPIVSDEAISGFLPAANHCILVFEAFLIGLIAGVSMFLPEGFSRAFTHPVGAEGKTASNTDESTLGELEYHRLGPGYRSSLSFRSGEKWPVFTTPDQAGR